MTRTKARAKKAAPIGTETAIENEIENDIDVILWFDAGDLIPYPDVNPRTHFDEAYIAELADSIRADGVLEPILVHDTQQVPYYIVAGECRWRAAQIAGRKLPAIVRDIPYAKALRLALVENMQRAQLTAIEEARAFDRMLQADAKLTEKRLGELVGKSQSYVSNRRRLLKLTGVCLQLVEDGRIDVSTARDVLLPFANIPEAKRDALFSFVADRFQASKGLIGEDLIRQALAMAVRNISNELLTGDAPSWDGYDGPLVTVKQHEKECKCGSPAFVFQSWNGKQVRCFDDAWWNAANDRAREAREKKRAQAQARAVEAAFEMNGRPVLKIDVFNKKFAYGSYEEMKPGTLVDPSLLPAESLVLVDRGAGRRPELVCTDKKAFAAAQRPLKKEKSELLTVRRAERTQKELELVNGDVQPWMLREVLEDRPATDQLLVVARDLDIDLGKHGEVYDRLKTLPDEQLVTLFKVVGLRSREHRLPYSAAQDPIESDVEREIAARFAPVIEAMLPTQQLSPEVAAQLAALETGLRALVSGARSAPPSSRDEGQQKLSQIQSACDAVEAFETENPSLWRPASLDAAHEEAQTYADHLADLFDLEIDGRRETECIFCGATQEDLGPEGFLATDHSQHAGVCSDCGANAIEAKEQLDEHLRELAREDAEDEALS